MKFKVKGLVFVGFAAAILSANAALADPDNTVTSKSYVDNKFQVKVEGSNNQLVQSTGTPGSVKYLTISDSEDSVDTTNGAGVVVSGKAVADAIDSAITEYDTEADLSQYEVLANKVQQGQTTGSVFTVDSSDDEYPSAKAVYTALAATGASVGNGTISVTQNGQNAGSFTTNQAGAGSITIVAPDWTAASGTAGYIDNKPTLGTASSQDVAASIADGGTGLTTSDQVYDALHDTSNVGNGGLTVTINGTAATGTYTANQSAGSTLAFTGIEETANKAAAIVTTGADENISTVGDYASTKAVYDYVQSQTGGNVIPEMPNSTDDPTGYCDASHPCALVTEDGEPVWKRIAQAGDQ